jgi:hypothetical protein
VLPRRARPRGPGHEDLDRARGGQDRHEVPAVAGQHPTEIDKRKTRKVDLHHLSWTQVLSEAVMQKEHRGVADADQAWILGELIRYLEHPRSGALEFEDMGALTSPMGTKRGRGRGSFIDAVLAAIDGFYADVVQQLKAWTAAPPRMREVADEQPVPPALPSTALSSQDGTAQATPPGRPVAADVDADVDAEPGTDPTG